MIALDVAPGIHRIEDSVVNWYLVEDEGRLLVVDAGVPSSWRSLQEILVRLGRSSGDVEAIVLTHAHADHVGFAERARVELGVPVWLDEPDIPMSRHPLFYPKERSPLLYGWRPEAVKALGSLVRAGSLRTKGLRAAHPYGHSSEPLDLPGRPRVVRTPGHTHGHCSLHFPARDAVVSGDALVTWDPYTATRGPRMVARAACADSDLARRSLDALAATGARTILPGHGEPWQGGASEAAELARRAGIG